MENNIADINVRTHIETLKGHGRIDEITYYQTPVSANLVNREKWSGLKTIGIAICQSKRGDKLSTDVRFYSSSLAMGVKRFARYVRRHQSSS